MDGRQFPRLSGRRVAGLLDHRVPGSYDNVNDVVCFDCVTLAK